MPLPQQEDQAPKLPINESVKSLYPQRNNVSNIYFFRLQQMTSKLKSVKDAGGTSDIIRNSTQRTFRFLCDQKKGEAVLQGP